MYHSKGRCLFLCYVKLLQIPVPEVSAIAMTISKLETLPQHDRSIRSSALNPRPILRLQAMRAAEMAAMKCGSSVDDLMEKAGKVAASITRSFAGNMPALILCGPGNNGGDGYVLARYLAEWGIPVSVAAYSEPKTEAAKKARSLFSGKVTSLDEAEAAPLLIDALFGVGMSRSLDNALLSKLTALSKSASLRIAIDVPSGVDTDKGSLLSDIPAFDLTIAIGALKPAHRLEPSATICGRVAVGDIDLTISNPDLIEIPKPCLAAPTPADYKYSRGYVAITAGAMAGASLLSAVAAQRAGAGYVALLGGETISGPMALVHRSWSREALADERINALVIGPGLGRDELGVQRLSMALDTSHPLVLDADALFLLSREGLDCLRNIQQPTIITPHEGEFKRLFEGISGDKLTRVTKAAALSGLVVVLKGADTVIATPDGRAAISQPAVSWLANAGTGDVLSGICGAMLARGMDPFDAACTAVWLHGEAARLAGPGMIADDLIHHLRSAFVEVTVAS